MSPISIVNDCVILLTIISLALTIYYAIEMKRDIDVCHDEQDNSEYISSVIKQNQLIENFCNCKYLIEIGIEYECDNNTFTYFFRADTYELSLQASNDLANKYKIGKKINNIAFYKPSCSIKINHEIPEYDCNHHYYPTSTPYFIAFMCLFPILGLCGYTMKKNSMRKNYGEIQ
jgi:hypothetical protein